jgi:hypothetical protein
LGEYSITLAKPGEYLVAIREPQFEVRSRKFSEGLNRFDWHITNVGSVVVRFIGVNRGEPVRADIRGKDTASFWSVQSPAAGEDFVKWQGLPFGDYLVAARQAGWASDTLKVSINPDRPHAELDLELHPSSLRVYVHDEIGVPVENAKFYPTRPVPEMTRPGVYEFAGMAAGQALVAIAGDFVPICRVTLTNSDTQIVLTKGSVVTLTVGPSEKRLNLSSGVLLDLPGSDCAVPISAFLSTGDASNSPGDGKLTLHNFPRASRVKLNVGNTTREILVRPDGTAHLR